jgi:hypothetical protein
MEVGSVADWVSGLGSLAAVAIAMWGYWLVARQRREDRRNAERGTAYETIAAIQEITNNILTIQKHVAAARNDVVVPAKSMRFRIINPMIGLSSEGDTRLPAGSAELLVKADAADLWNSALLAANHNRALVSILKEYRDLWAETMARLPPLVEVSESGLRARADGSSFDALKPELIKLDAIVGALEVQVAEAAKLAHSVAGEIGPVLNTYFKEAVLHLTPAEQQEQAASPSAPRAVT